jgi:dienelactone hydrolase
MTIANSSMTSTVEPIHIDHDGTTLCGVIALPAQDRPAPGVLVFPTAFGLGEQMQVVAGRLADQGFTAIAVDMFGGGTYTENQKELEAIIPALWGTELARARSAAWLGALKARPEVDASRTAAIGYCFGGQCVLELARSGADLIAVASFHGILSTSWPARSGELKAHVAVYTGAKDPHAPAADVAQLRDELTAAGASWQITEFGQAYHAFTDPEAQSPDQGRAYDPLADRVSWASMFELLGTTLAQPLSPSAGSKT